MAQTKEQKKAANRLSSAKRRQREKDSVSKLDTQMDYWERLLDLHHEAIRKAGLPIPPRDGSTNARQPTSGIEPAPQAQAQYHALQHANADVNSNGTGNGTGDSLAPLSTEFACRSDSNVLCQSHGAMLLSTARPSWESSVQSQENACQSPFPWQSQSQSDSQHALSGEDLFQAFLQDDFGDSNMEDSAQYLGTSLGSEPDLPAVNAPDGGLPPLEELDIESLLQGFDEDS